MNFLRRRVTGFEDLTVLQAIVSGAVLIVFIGLAFLIGFFATIFVFIFLAGMLVGILMGLPMLKANADKEAALREGGPSVYSAGTKAENETEVQ